MLYNNDIYQLKDLVKTGSCVCKDRNNEIEKQYSVFKDLISHV